METTTIVNLALFGILFVSSFVGFAKGFLEQAIELVGTIGSFIIAILMAGGLARFLEGRFDAPYSVWLVVSFIGLVIAGLIVTHLVAAAIGRVVKMTILRMIDRFTGAVLGLIMGMIVASLAITLTLELPLPSKFRKDVARSSMSLFLRPVAGQLFNWLVSGKFNDKRFEDFFKHGKTV